MQIQDLNIVIPKIQRHFKKNPNASISAMFRNLRKLSYLSFIGDYSILSIIVTTISEMGIVISKSALQYAARQSEELKGQTTLLRQLLNDHKLILKNLAETLYDKRKDQETSNLSSK